jgi:hypothetical protein
MRLPFFHEPFFHKSWHGGVRLRYLTPSLDTTRCAFILTALDASPERLDQHEQKFVQRIREHGWLGTHVTPDDNGPGFSYTTGFSRKFRRFRR